MSQMAELVVLELHGYKAEPGTLLALGDAWAYREENEKSNYANRIMTLEEMKVIQDYYRQPEVIAARKEVGLGAMPTDAELGSLAASSPITMAAGAP